MHGAERLYITERFVFVKKVKEHCLEKIIVV